jgi:hypothetical protein
MDLMVNFKYIEIFSGIVYVVENPIIPLDRAHRVVLGTSITAWEQVSERILYGSARIRTQLHLHLGKPQFPVHCKK